MGSAALPRSCRRSEQAQLPGRTDRARSMLFLTGRCRLHFARHRGVSRLSDFVGHRRELLRPPTPTAASFPGRCVARRAACPAKNGSHTYRRRDEHRSISDRRLLPGSAATNDGANSIADAPPSTAADPNGFPTTSFSSPGFPYSAAQCARSSSFKRAARSSGKNRRAPSSSTRRRVPGMVRANHSDQRTGK